MLCINFLRQMLPCLLLTVFSLSAHAQSKTYYIIAVEGNKAVIDITEHIRTGDEIPVYGPGGRYIHPVTKKEIKKQPELIARLRVTHLAKDYTEAEIIPHEAASKLKPGQPFTWPLQTGDARSATQPNPLQPEKNAEGRSTVVIAPAQVNDVVDNGHFGGYVADMLMEQLLMCDKVKLLDRSVLNAQMSETNLKGSYIDPQTAIRQGKIIGARYMVQVTMQKPDVVNVRTGIPLASLMTAVGSMTRTNIGAPYSSNIQVGTLRAEVSLSARIIDLESGEILYMTNASGKAKGKSQLKFEYGALNGGELNGGAEGFKQTVTGQAVQKAFITIGKNLSDYFNGKATRRVEGSLNDFNNRDTQMYAKGTRLYLGTEKLDKESVAQVMDGHDELYFRYKKAKQARNAGNASLAGGLALAAAAILITDGNGDEAVNAGLGLAIGGLAAGITGKILFQKKASRLTREVAGEYNETLQVRHTDPAAPQLEYSIGIGHMSLAFCF